MATKNVFFIQLIIQALEANITQQGFYSMCISVFTLIPREPFKDCILTVFINKRAKPLSNYKFNFSNSILFLLFASIISFGNEIISI